MSAQRALIDLALAMMKDPKLRWEIHHSEAKTTFTLYYDQDKDPQLPGKFEFEMGMHDALNVLDQVELNLKRIR